MNFAQMKTKVADYLNRSDLTAIIPDFINMAIHKVERKHKLNYMQATQSYTFTQGTYYYTIPSNYWRVKWFKFLNNSYWQDITRTAEEDALFAYPDYTNNIGVPIFFARVPVQNSWLIRPTPDQTYTASMTYYALSTDLVGDSDTHWLLTNFWEVVLYGALLEASPYLGDDARIAVWKAGFDDAINELTDAEKSDGSDLADNTMQPAYRTK